MTEKKKSGAAVHIIGAVLCVVFGFFLVCNIIIIVKGTLHPETPPTVLGVAPMVVLSTASPFKFPRSVLEALGHTAPQNDFEAMRELEAVTHHDAPASLAALRQKAERFSTVIDPARIAQVALSYES